MFNGCSRYACVGVLAAGGLAGAPAAIASAALLGVRNAAYAMRMAPVIAGGFWRKAAATQFTIDESVAVGLSQHTSRARRAGFWVTGIAIWVGWNLSTLVGALLGDVLGDPRAYGLDAAAAAAFLALLWPRLRGRQPLGVAAGAAVVAALLTPALMPGIPVIAAAGVAVAVGLFDPRRPEPGVSGTLEEKGMP